MHRPYALALALTATIILGGCAAESGSTVVPGTPTAPQQSSPPVDAASAPPEASPAETAEPTMEATPEVTPAPIEAKIGSKVKVGDEQYHTVVKVQPYAGSTYIKPDKGNVFVAALVKIQAITETSYNPFNYKVRDADGFEYSISVFGKDPALSSSNNLQPGRSVQGWVTFEVPKAASKKLTMIYAPGFFMEPVEIRLY